MSLTIVQKSDLSRPKRNPKLALVLAGGAISGGAFKVGGIIALNRFIRNRKVTDFDIYVCLSAGAFIGTFLAGNMPPEELLRALDGTSDKLTQFQYTHFYWPAFREYARRSRRLGRDAIRLWPSVVGAFARHISGSREAIGKRVMDFLAHPGYTTFENVIGPMVSEVLDSTPLPHAGRYVPSGIFDNSRIEKYIRQNLANNHIPNDFRVLHRERGVSLYVTATNLNTARGVVFGHDADHTVTISEAVQASTCIPGFYVPARIGGEEYLDAMVRKTANASLAMHKGADLIIIYNPFRPFMNRNRYQLTPNAASLSELGMGMVLNQTVRTMMQTRLYLGIEKLRMDPTFKGDVILIEPMETDAEFFALNPLAFWNRQHAARHGFNQVRRTLEQNHIEVARILNAYGIDCDLAGMSGDIDVFGGQAIPTEPARPEPEVLRARRPRLTVVK